jgi:hypothetical protein
MNHPEKLRNVIGAGLDSKAMSDVALFERIECHD